MIKVLLVLHVFVTIALIGVVLIQRSEGGGLGLGGAQGMGNFMSGRGTANLLTRTTAILGTAFFILSLGLALLYRSAGTDAAAILNAPQQNIPGGSTSGNALPGPATGTLPGSPVPGSPANLPQTPADALPAPLPPASTPPAVSSSPVPAQLPPASSGSGVPTPSPAPAPSQGN